MREQAWRSNALLALLRVHATDLGEPPVLPDGQFPVNAKVPLVVGLNAIFGQGTAEPMLSASWFPAAGAIYYIAEISYDKGASWAQVYEGQGNQFVAVVTAAALTLRVQAVNSTIKGPFSSVSVQAPTIVIASQTVALKSLIEGLQYQVTTLQDQVKSQADQVTQLLASISAGSKHDAFLALGYVHAKFRLSELDAERRLGEGRLAQLAGPSDLPSDEFELRLAGATYDEISRAGGGIVSTMHATREETEDQLLASARKRVETLMRDGVTKSAPDTPQD